MTLAADPGLHRKLVWITFFRVVMFAVLLGGTAAVGWNQAAPVVLGLTPLFVLTGVVFAASAVFALALRDDRWNAAVAYAQIVLDVGVATAVVAMTGRSDSVFLFLFSLAVVNGAILLFRRGAATSGALSVVGYLGLNARLFDAPPVAPATLFTHGAAFAGTAVLAAYLAEQLRTTGERLAARESDLATLTALHGVVVESMTSGLVTLDPDGRITFLNPAAEELLGVARGDALGRPGRELLPHFDGGAGRAEVDFTNGKGVRLRIGYTSFPLDAQEGRSLGSAVNFQDLTSLQAMEDAVQRAERLADLGRLAAGLAHEIRNPLASMSGSIELLRGSVKAGGDEARLMEIVLREAGRLNELVSQFLAFARPAPPRRRRTELSELLAEALSVFRNDPRAAAVRLEASLVPAEAECDPDQVRQVVWNLLTNAAQAIAAAARSDGGAIVARCGAGPGGPFVEVEDDGVGMTGEELSKLFIPFFTTKPGGTGLGLATIHRIVDAHGGSIRVASERGKGSRFTVILPAPRAEE